MLAISKYYALILKNQPYNSESLPHSYTNSCSNRTLSDKQVNSLPQARGEHWWWLSQNRLSIETLDGQTFANNKSLKFLISIS